MVFIANTSTLSNFAAVERLDLLKSRFETLYISSQVFDEIQTGLIEGYAFYDSLVQYIFPFSDTGFVSLTAFSTKDEMVTFSQLLNSLHSGEASCLSIAYHRQWTFLSDDKAARKVGRRLKVPISGTLGILLSLVKREILSLIEADKILQQMIDQGYYSPITSLNEILGV